MISSEKQLNERFVLNAIKCSFGDYYEAFWEAELYFINKPYELVKNQVKNQQGLDDVTNEEIEEVASTLDYRSTNILPATLRSSYLIGFYSLYEYYLNKLCIFAQKILNKDIGIEIIKGKGIWRARTYLEDVCKIKITNQKEWNDIKHLNIIRNAFVHNYGIISNEKDINKYIQENNKIIILLDDKTLILQKGFIDHCKSVMEKHLEIIIKEIYA